MSRESIANQLIYLLSEEALGRRSLVKHTGLTESVVRRELEKLREQGIVSMSKLGTQLTLPGKRRFRKVLQDVKQIKELKLKELSIDRFNMAALVRGIRELKTWHYRDLAIREGASGAIFISCTKDKLRFTDSEAEIKERNPKDARMVKEAFTAREDGDLIVIVFAKAKKEASMGLWRIISKIFKLSERTRTVGST